MTTADANRQRKAQPIARALWRRGMTVEHLFLLPAASRDRTVPTMNRFARTAYAEAGVEEAEPHGPGSPTWRLVDILLTKMARYAGGHPDSPDVPARDLLDDRPNWLPEATCPTTTTPDPSLAPEAAVTSLMSTTSAADASPTSTPSRESPSGIRTGEASTAPAAGPDPIYDFPRAEGASCPCGVWHRRYGPQGGGALCPDCRTRALASAAEA